ncbi:MAG: NirD/YgiW/YdeI family stress tolerance protein [Treponema sp.]|nr:NirD/YgiW/YdeI family stress tolerance protein [Treponema sp.]
MNKKQFVLLFCLVVSFAFAAYAQQGGYKGPGTRLVTVAEAKNLRDTSFVILQGKIVRMVMPRQYLFSDDTGEISVMIKDSQWGDVSVDENDTVEIQGIVFNRNTQLPHFVTVQSIRKL